MAKRKRTAYQSFVSRRMKQLIHAGMPATKAMKQVAAEWRSGKRNPLEPGMLAVTPGGLAKVTGKRSRGGIFGLGARRELRVEGAGIPGGSGWLPSQAVVSPSELGPLANPILACPSCANPVRVRGRTVRCRHCGAYSVVIP